MVTMMMVMMMVMMIVIMVMMIVIMMIMMMIMMIIVIVMLMKVMVIMMTIRIIITIYLHYSSWFTRISVKHPCAEATRPLEGTIICTHYQLSLLLPILLALATIFGL